VLGEHFKRTAKQYDLASTSGDIDNPEFGLARFFTHLPVIVKALFTALSSI